MEIVVNDVKKHFDDASDYINLVDKLVTPQTQNLDNLINNIKSLVQQPNCLIANDVLEYNYLNLSTELYLMIDKLKEFEIYSAFAKANEGEAYNNAYLTESTSSDKKPAVAELQIRAEIKSKKESVVNAIYNSAFKTIKNKIDAGNLVADTLKNIIKNRNSIDFTANQTNNNRSN